MLEVARRLSNAQGRGELAELRCQDIQQLDLHERFDLVIANGLFDYLAPVGPTLSRAASWCRGVCVASFPDKKAFRAIPRSLYWRRRGVQIHAFDGAEVDRLAAAAGFAAYAVEYNGPLYLLIARMNTAHGDPTSTASPSPRRAGSSSLA
jgi:hypothetical protein